ncbi:MAG: tRNA (adenosine(37)-N6)-dimethylallyltransferase MiaA [Francisellaceae bacterium]
MSRHPLIYALAGPTASGKTASSVWLARQLNAEIINVDSALIYKHMDIGTAKPGFEERGGVLHHLIDIVEPWQSYSVADFLDDCQKKITAIHARGRRVLLVGGSMMYFKALIEGISSLPETDHDIRDEVCDMATDELVCYLQKHDPETAVRFNPNDRQRLSRAVEVLKISGIPYSRWLQHSPKIGGLGESIRLVALMPSDRLNLHRRIERRFKLMLNSGFLDEVKRLMAMPQMHKELPSMRSVGYRQAWQYLEGDGDYDLFFNKAVAATRQLAKRQLTWIRNWPFAIERVSVDENPDSERLLAVFMAK